MANDTIRVKNYPKKSSSTKARQCFTLSWPRQCKGKHNAWRSQISGGRFGLFFRQVLRKTIFALIIKWLSDVLFCRMGLFSVSSTGASVITVISDLSYQNRLRHQSSPMGKEIQIIYSSYATNDVKNSISQTEIWDNCDNCNALYARTGRRMAATLQRYKNSYIC